MKIIAQKTDYNDINTFFNRVALEEYVDGVGFNIVFTRTGNLLVYSPNTSEAVDTLNLQKNNTNDTILTLEEVLTRMENTRDDIEIILNLIPIDYNVVDEESLQVVSRLYRSYIEKLNEVIEKHPTLNILVYSLNRTLVTIAKEIIKNRDLGFLLYGGDLTPIDVDFYVFTANMIDDAIFSELLDRNKGIYLLISDNSDLGLVVNNYKSKYATAQSQRVLPSLGFIIAQPNLVDRIFND